MTHSPLKTVLFWSGGKDAAYALHLLNKNPEYQVAFLVTTLNIEKQEAAMHKIPYELVQAQADALNISLVTVSLPEMPSGELYKQKHLHALEILKREHNVQCIAFGDIFLEDLKTYREKLFEPLGLPLVYPLWEKETKALSMEIIESGIKALTVCTDAKVLDETFSGRTLDFSFLNDLPEGADPCGENGEFHTFVYDGPDFSGPIHFTTGNTTLKKYGIKDSEVSSEFWYLEIKD